MFSVIYPAGFEKKLDGTTAVGKKETLGATSQNTLKVTFILKVGGRSGAQGIPLDPFNCFP